MSRYDLIFTLVMIGSITLTLNAFAFGFFSLWLNLWYLLLVPFAIIKILYKNSKIDNWLHDEI